MQSLIVLLAVVLLSVVFTLQNAHVVETKALFWSFTSPLAVIIVISLLLGVAMGIGVALVSSAKKRGAEKKARKKEADKTLPKTTLDMPPPPAGVPDTNNPQKDPLHR